MARFTSFLTIMFGFILLAAVAAAAKVTVEESAEKNSKAEQIPEADADIDFDSERFKSNEIDPVDDDFSEDGDEEMDIEEKMEVPHVNRKLLSAENVEKKTEQVNSPAEDKEAAAPKSEVNLVADNVEHLADEDHDDFDGEEEDEEVYDDELPHFLRTANEDDELDFDDEDLEDAAIEKEDEKAAHVNRKLLSVADEMKNQAMDKTTLGKTDEVPVENTDATMEAEKVQRTTEEGNTKPQDLEKNAENLSDNVDGIDASVHMQHQPEDEDDLDFDDDFEDFEEEDDY